jgi:hypothetical protein
VCALTASTAAFASPRIADRNDPQQTYQRDRNDGGWTRDRYDHYGQSHWNRDFRGRWVSLARGFSGASERQFIHVNAGRYNKLRVEAVQGQPVIRKIAIEFGDGTSQAVDVDMRLARGAGEVIDLNGGARVIKRIIVYSDPRARGSYSIYGA